MFKGCLNGSFVAMKHKCVATLRIVRAVGVMVIINFRLEPGQLLRRIHLIYKFNLK